MKLFAPAVRAVTGAVRFLVLALVGRVGKYQRLLCTRLQVRPVTAGQVREFGPQVPFQLCVGQLQGDGRAVNVLRAKPRPGGGPVYQRTFNPTLIADHRVGQYGVLSPVPGLVGPAQGVGEVQHYQAHPAPVPRSPFDAETAVVHGEGKARGKWIPRTDAEGDHDGHAGPPGPLCGKVTSRRIVQQNFPPATRAAGFFLQARELGLGIPVIPASDSGHKLPPAGISKTA